jgi:hypothetical protein
MTPVDGSMSDAFVLPDADPLCAGDMPAAPTFANVQQVFEVCTPCHTLGAPLDLRPSVAYTNLVGRPTVNYTNPPTDESCGGTLVTAGDATASYLFQKISLRTPCAGQQMPLEEIGPIARDSCRQSLVRDWINAGALDD